MKGRSYLTISWCYDSKNMAKSPLDTVGFRTWGGSRFLNATDKKCAGGGGGDSGNERTDFFLRKTSPILIGLLRNNICLMSLFSWESLNFDSSGYRLCYQEEVKLHALPLIIHYINCNYDYDDHSYWRTWWSRWWWSLEDCCDSVASELVPWEAFKALGQLLCWPTTSFIITVVIITTIMINAKYAEYAKYEKCAKYTKYEKYAEYAPNLQNWTCYSNPAKPNLLNQTKDSQPN